MIEIMNSRTGEIRTIEETKLRFYDEEWVVIKSISTAEVVFLWTAIIGSCVIFWCFIGFGNV